VIGYSFWPTPNKMDGAGIRAKQSVESWAADRIRHALKGNRKQLNICIAAKAFPSGMIPRSQESMIRLIVESYQSGRSWPPHGGLNPEWIEWLMGFPLGWTALAPSETP
jgi:hypothetical protein